MSAVGNTWPTLIDVASRTQDKKIAKLAELLNKTNEVLDVLPIFPCNDGSGHKASMRTGIPTPTWRMFNQGVQPTKSQSATVRETTGMMEDYGQVDKALADNSGDANGFRLSENMAKIEGFNQAFADSLIYGNSNTEVNKFLGLAPRFNSTSAGNSDQILSAGHASATNTSIWIVVFGEHSVHGLYPQGMKAGLEHKDLGEQTHTFADGSMMQVYRDHFKWACGLAVKDWRYVVRIQVQPSALTKNASTGADLIDLLTDGVERVHNLNSGRAAILCNRTIRGYLRRQIVNKSNVHLSIEQVAGKKVLTFDEIPVLRCDSLVNTEAQIGE